MSDYLNNKRRTRRIGGGWGRGLGSLRGLTAGLLVLGAICGCGSDDSGAPATVRQLGEIDSVLADGINGRVVLTESSDEAETAILLQGETVANLLQEEAAAIQASYDAGYTVTLLDADLEHIAALHDIVGEGLAYDSETEPTVMAYTLRRHGHVPTATILTDPRKSPLGLENDDAAALDRATDVVVGELSTIGRAPVDDLGDDGPVSWQNAPLQTTTLAQNGYWGIYNTLVNVFALHACLDGTDRYVVTAEADWTPTQARFQTANLDDNPGWENGKKWCAASAFPVEDLNLCRYINYPLFYRLDMEAPTTGTVLQINAAPGGTQGTTTSYMSGFAFNIGGTVNVSAMGPSGGIRIGASWTNTVTSTVPPLQIEAGNIDNTENAFWKYEYCTAGEEVSGGCTNHVQTAGTSGTCKAFKMGDPQNGQTPNGKFSDVVTSTYWQAAADTRVGDTFDITVTFDAEMGTTWSNLYGTGSLASDASCNFFNCSCKSTTTSKSEKSAMTFKIPFPSTKCDSDG